MFSRTLVQAVREMLERHWDATEIASKMCIDVSVVTEIIRQLTT